MTRKLWLIGLAWFTYGVSFIFPAVDNGSKSGLISSNPIPGWLCAYAALLMPLDLIFGPKTNLSQMVPLFLSGILNVLVIAGLLASLTARTRSLARLMIMIAVPLLPCAWYVIWTNHMRPLVGHWLWAGSILALAVLMSKTS